jgi:hypothetical protein
MLLPLARLPDHSSLCPVMFCCCGLRGLRGTILERRSLQPVSLANGSDRAFPISETSKSEQKAHFEHAQFEAAEKETKAVAPLEFAEP